MDVIVYKLTIANSVEERILALQEKKRALAEAAIEGKAVGKLSMKDIMNLFRRDAEHEHGHGGEEFGAKTKVLSAGGGGAERMGRRETPPVMERARGGVKEDAVFGRRW